MIFTLFVSFFTNFSPFWRVFPQFSPKSHELLASILFLAPLLLLASLLTQTLLLESLLLLVLPTIANFWLWGPAAVAGDPVERCWLHYIHFTFASIPAFPGVGNVLVVLLLLSFLLLPDSGNLLAGKFNRLASPESIFLNLQRLKMTCGARGMHNTQQKPWPTSKMLWPFNTLYLITWLFIKKVNIITQFSMTGSAEIHSCNIPPLKVKKG